MKHRSRGRHERSGSGGVMPVILAASVVTVIALALLFGPDLANAIRGRNTQKSLQELYRGSDGRSLIDLLIPRAYAEEFQPEPTSEPMTVHEDFAALYEQNEDLVGWLSAGERIHYPVVQFDNVYYLDHDFFGKEDESGSLFVNEANLMKPRDQFLLIHGHNMRVGTMFGDLDFFREYKYLCRHPIVTFRTIEDAEDVYYVPIAGFDASIDPDEEGFFDITRLRFEFDIAPEQPEDKPRSTEMEQYISELRAASYWRSPAEADSTDEYIVLITCSYFHEEGRMILVCRKLREGETPETVRALFAH